MCNLFHKAERQRLSEEKIAQLNQESVFQLRQYSLDHKNGQKFTQKIYDELTD